MSTKTDSEISDMDLDLELTPLGNDDIDVRINRRFKTQTDKGRAYQIERKKAQCKSVQKRITKIMKTIEGSINDWGNVHEVQNDLEVFSQQLVEFQAAYESWRVLLSEQELVPVTDWYEEHWRIMNNCKVRIVDWIAVAKYKLEEQLDDKSSALKSSIESRRSAGSRHSSTSGRARERAKVAELKAKAALLEKKQALENESEKLRLQEELAIAQAREQAFIQNDIELKLEATTDGMNEYLEDTRQEQKEDLHHDQLSTNIPSPQFTSTNISQPPPVSAFHSKRAHQIPVRLPRYSSPHINGTASSPRLPAQQPFTEYAREWRPPPSDYRNRVTLDNYPLIHLMEKQNRLTEMLSEQHQQNFLPPLSLSSFKGDPTEYHLFIRTFEMRVERNVKSSGARMQYLEQYLDGEPKDLIKGCHYMETNAGYVEALRLLNEKYGDPYKVSNAYLKKVNDWPTLKSGDDNALERLAIFLTQCLSAMESLSYLMILDHPNNLQCLVKKLPFYQQERWRREVTKLREKGKNPTFKHFVEFVKTEAKIATDPVFSRRALDKIGQDDNSKFRKGSTPKFTSNATVMKEGSRDPCIVCNGSHDLDECKVYLKKSLPERRALIAKRGLCYACYGSGHRSRGCMQRRSCKTCSGRHPTGLHDENFRMKNKNSDVQSRNSDRTEDINSDNQSKGCAYAAAGEVVCDASNVTFSMESMPIVPVRLRSNDKEIITYAMLDSCSTGTFISEDAVKRLAVNGTDTKVIIRTMNGPKLHDTKVVNGLVVSNLDGANSITLPKVFSQNEIPGRKSEIPRQELCRKWKHLENVVEHVHPYMENVKIGLLIGTNCPEAIEPRDFVASNNGGPFAVLTFAGWTIVGPLYMSNNENQVDCHRIVVQEIGSDKPSEHHFMVEKSVKELVTPESLNKMLELEFNERQCQKEQDSQEDKRFMEKIQRDTKYVDGHYVIPLPFRDDDVHMPSNKEQVILRTNWLKKKLTKNSTFRQDYTKFMNDIFKKGYARRVPDEYREPEEGKVWYLPHHGVYQAKKTDKIRVVFDCSARFRGTSLNEQLLQGPNRTNSLIGVLTRFREEHSAFIADIESMFYQVRVQEEHKTFLRFLWWPNSDLSQELVEYQMNVHLFGGVSSPSCSNYALRRTADDFEEEEGTEAANVLRKNFYVDDCLRSEKTEELAIERINSVTRICAHGGFRLTKFTSNKRRVLETIPEEERSKELKSLDLSYEHLPIERALGVQWFVESDELGFKIVLNDKPLTRRGVLSTISSIYDPIGMAAPILLPGKRILQDLCREKVGWDDALPEEYRARWERWRNELPALERFGLARCLKPPDFGTPVNRQIHSFSDASFAGYGQVSYLRQVNDRGDIHCAFLMGKSRLTPLKSVTIPRLELAAAVLSAKLGTMLKNELELLDKETYWTDSTTVIKYINNDKARFHTYVATRVQAIRDRTDVNQWRYVDTKENPADDASRGMEIHRFLKQQRWTRGPEFLWRPEIEWPECPGTVKEIGDYDLEIKTAHSTIIEQNDLLKRLEYFSQWSCVKKVVAWLLRLFKPKYEQTVRMTRNNAKKISEQKPRPITVEEMEKAEIVILKLAQNDYFPDEIAALKEVLAENHNDPRAKIRSKKKKIKMFSSLFRLDPFIDINGLLRVGGRLGKSTSLPEDLRHPVILPKKSHITTLVIRHSHEKVAHAGRGNTLNELRSRYWITNANSAVRHYISKCVKCRRLRAVVGEQMMADLPKDRVTPAPPFTYCAVDYFGPYLVKEGRKQLKRYGVLFTCLASRAVHLETAIFLESDSFICALRRFVARRGPVRQMRSDRGTNFIGAERELKSALEEMDHKRIQEISSKEFNADWLINWNRNPPAASHMGGVWERQIRTVRSILSSLLRDYGHALNDESLRTLLTEVECIVNSRPLTFPSGDATDPQPLTPNHILTMTFIFERDGEESNTWQTYFGQDGKENICKLYRRERSGTSLKETSK